MAAPGGNSLAEANPALLAFNRGRVSPKALARVDIQRMAFSADEQTNLPPRVLGSMSLRPGWEYLFSTNGNAAAKYLPFVFATSDTALIEVTPSGIRFGIDDAVVTRASVSTAIANGTFDSNILSWTDADETGSTSTWVAGGYLELVGTLFNAAIRRQQVTVAGADQNAEHGVTFVIERGPVSIKVGSTDGGAEYVSERELGTGTYSFAFTPTGDFHIELAGRAQAASMVDSVAVDSSGDFSLPSPWAAADLDKLRWSASGNVVFVACDGYQQRRIERPTSAAPRSWGISLYQPNDGPFQSINTSTIKLTPSGLTGDITLTASRALFDSTHIGALFSILSVGQTVAATLTGADEFTDDDSMRITGVSDSRIFTVEISGRSDSTITLQRSIDETGSWTDVATYTADQGATNYDDSLDNVIAFYRIGIKTGDYGSDTVTATLVSPNGGIKGVARVTAYTSSLVVSAAVLSNMGGTAASRDWQEGSWSDFSGFPSATALYEGRKWWAGIGNFFGSISDAFDSFDEDFEGDAGPINRNIGEGPVDDVNWLLPLQRLLAGTAGAEISARSTSLDEPLTPSNFNVKDASTQGSAVVPAVKIDTGGIFVQRGGTRVFELGQGSSGRSIYSDEYLPVDLTDIIPEIGEPGIVRMAVQRQPDTRLHCVRSDGTVAMLIREPDNEVLCWIDIETDGNGIEDVVVLPGTVEDKVYYTVKRTVNSVEKRFLEKWALESDANVHSTVYDSTSTTSITGLDYDDATIVTVRDSAGTKIENLTVTSGAITLSTAATYAHITPAVCKLADSFVAFSNSPASATVSGLDHLEGESLVVFADGKALEDSSGDIATFTVSSGAIAMTDGGAAYTAEEGVVGLAFRGRFKSTKLAYASQLGSALTQRKRMSHLGLVMANTHAQGVTYGPNFSTLDGLPLIDDEGAEVVGHTIHKEYDKDMFEWPGGWGTDERMCLEFNAPRPATVMAVVVGIDETDKA
jgi:hypothetical protein